MTYMKHVKLQTILLSWQMFIFPTKVYRMLKYVYDDSNVTADNNINKDDMYIATALVHLCLSAVLKTNKSEKFKYKINRRT